MPSPDAPETFPPPSTPTPSPGYGRPNGRPLATRKQAKAQAKAAKAYAKAQRPFYKKKRFIIPAALVVVVILMTTLGGGSKTSKVTAANGAVSSASNALYPNRPDAQDKDHEAAIGQGAELRGRTATVTSANFQPSLSQFENDGYIVADVTILNRNSDAQPYNLLDWRIQTPNGQVLDPAFTALPDQLQSGDLVGNGTVNGKVVFKVGSAPQGQFFLIYKPDAFASDRGIWGVTLP
jgi:hypothetical protein